MRSRTEPRKADTTHSQSERPSCNEKMPEHDLDSSESPAESDESSDLDEFDPQNCDDDRWDVFILDDDDCEPLPEYGDFWLPD